MLTQRCNHFQWNPQGQGGNGFSSRVLERLLSQPQWVPLVLRVKRGKGALSKSFVIRRGELRLWEWRGFQFHLKVSCKDHFSYIVKLLPIQCNLKHRAISFICTTGDWCGPCKWNFQTTEIFSLNHQHFYAVIISITFFLKHIAYVPVLWNTVQQSWAAFTWWLL